MKLVSKGVNRFGVTMGWGDRPSTAIIFPLRNTAISHFAQN